MRDVRPVASGLGDHLPAAIRMLAEFAPRGRAEAAALRGFQFLLGDQRDRAIEADIEDLVAVLEIGVNFSVLDIRPEASDAGEDRLAILRMRADRARQ